jgi:hypothetical protein
MASISSGSKLATHFSHVTIDAAASAPSGVGWFLKNVNATLRVDC